MIVQATSTFVNDRHDAETYDDRDGVSLGRIHIARTFRGGAWSGRDLTPGAGEQEVLAVTAAGGRGTVLAASHASDRLYAVADL